MPFWYYFSVPRLPPEVAHQSNLVEIRNYLTAEGSPVDVGSPIALVENYWAVMTLRADGECIPYGKEPAVLEITEHKRSKPTRDNRSA
jgi:hypothetical protein